MKLRVIIRPDEEDGGFVASCPALPGCHSQGDSREEALMNIREAIEGYLTIRNEKTRVHGNHEELAEVEV